MASILSITNTYDTEPKRKNRWTLRFTNVPVFQDDDPFSDSPTPTSQVRSMTTSEIVELQLGLLTASRPQVDIGETEFHRLNEKSYWPEGKATYEPIEISYYDKLGLNTGSFLYGWFRAVFDFKTGAVGYKKAFVSDGILDMLDPKGVVIERWTLKNCWPKTVNFNDLSYEDAGAAMINVTVRYDRAIPQFANDFTVGLDSNKLVAGSAFGVPNANAFNQGIQVGGGFSVQDFPNP